MLHLAWPSFYCLPIAGELRSVLESESVAEEEELVFDCVHPIDPVVDSGTSREFVWNSLGEEFVMKVAVDLIEEVFAAAVDGDVQGTWLQEMRHVDDGVLLPALQVFLISSKSLRNMPITWEWSDIDTS